MKKVLLEISQNSPDKTFFIEHLVAASVLFQSILLVLTKFSFWQENWALAYHSMKGVGFLCSKPLGGSKFNQLSLSSF